MLVLQVSLEKHSYGSQSAIMRFENASRQARKKKLCFTPQVLLIQECHTLMPGVSNELQPMPSSDSTPPAASTSQDSQGTDW